MSYNTYYKTENLFGEPYLELIEFFTNYLEKGKVLDLGCGQGRDAISIARLGYEVVGIDSSKVGINQMLKVAEREHLKLKGKVADIYEYDQFQDFDFVLFDSMFHFQKKDKTKETALIKRTIKNVKDSCIVIFCLPDKKSKVQILNVAIDFEKRLERLADIKFKYKWEDMESGHQSTSDYLMVIVQK